jgi:Flp pilus assembly protein TadD
MLYATTFDLAQQNQQAHQYSEALRYFAEASKMRPEDPDPHRRMAKIYTLMGRPDQAKTEQEIADKLTGNSGAS